MNTFGLSFLWYTASWLQAASCCFITSHVYFRCVCRFGSARNWAQSPVGATQTLPLSCKSDFAAVLGRALPMVSWASHILLPSFSFSFLLSLPSRISYMYTLKYDHILPPPSPCNSSWPLFPTCFPPHFMFSLFSKTTYGTNQCCPCVSRHRTIH